LHIIVVDTVAWILNSYNIDPKVLLNVVKKFMGKYYILSVCMEIKNDL
jgi:hypothetical protein